ncbi:MAG: beta-lactamase family protein [Thermotogaceae bacterium]|nr:beta-lactamase family protein [Thermotogaceae bacterium]
MNGFRWIHTMGVLILLIFSITNGFAQSTLAERLDALCLEEHTWMGFWGVVLVARGEDILFEKEYGYADCDHSRPIHPNLKFRIASITKQITAAAILKLSEENRLTLQDPLSKYLPAFSKHPEITLYQLLTHTSGIVTLLNTSSELNDRIQTYPGETTLEKTLAYLHEQPLRFEPGEGFYYSNGGYAILSAVIEKVTGQSYADYLKKTFFIPLGMTDTGYDPNAYDESWAIPCHRLSVEPDAVEPAPWVNRDIPYGAGGLYSTARDLLKWSVALGKGELLQPETLRLMETPQSEVYGNGLGVFIEHPPFNGIRYRLVFHDGATAGSSTHLSRYVDKDLTIVILSNLDDYDFTMLAYQLAKIVFSEE